MWGEQTTSLTIIQTDFMTESSRVQYFFWCACKVPDDQIDISLPMRTGYVLLAEMAVE